MPKEDALIVSRVKNAGAVILGKTNVPLLLSDWQSYNDIYGTTNNPWDLGRTPGGSSGGSAAALACGFGPLSLGSDIGGSLRVPAHYCGVYAHKPTLGLVPGRGHTPPRVPPLPRESDLAVVGPMTRSAADLALALDVVAGPDEERAGIGYRLALRSARHDDLKSFRVLVIDTHPLGADGKRGEGGARSIVGAARPCGRQSRARQSIASGPRRIGTTLHAAVVFNLGGGFAARRLRQDSQRGRSALAATTEPRGRAHARCGHEPSRLARSRLWRGPGFSSSGASFFANGTSCSAR